MKPLLSLILALAIILPVTPSLPASAAITWTVTKTADTNDGICDSDCSLREAIAAAASGDTIVFAPALSGGTIMVGSTLILSRDVTIDGSALAPPITLDGANAVRVFEVNAGVTATINALTITRARGAIYGGGIYNYGTLTVTNCWFVANTSINGGAALRNNGTMVVADSIFTGNSGNGGWGGAILNDRVMTVRHSTFTGNTIGTGAGGAIANINSSTLIVIDSTLTDNHAGDGGGIFNHYGPLTVLNSTFAGNSARSGGGIASHPGTVLISNSTFSGNTATAAGASGGGIATGSPTTVLNSTFSGNAAAQGGGIASTLPNYSLNFSNSIVANSTAGGDCSMAGTIGTNLNNLVEDGSCSLNGVNFQTGDPQLGPLADNGGPTPTFALLPGSPAIDAGDNATCAAPPVNGVDQRGQPRSATQCDVGAFELQNRPPVAEANGPYGVPEGGSVVLDGTASYDPDPGDSLTYAWDLDDDGVYGETGPGAGRGDEVGATPTFSAANLDGPGTFTIGLHVTDQGGLTGADTAAVDITNVAPALDPPTVTPQPLAEGSETTMSVTFSDPAAADIHAVTVAWGDGSTDSLVLAVGARAFAVVHRYLDDNPSGTPSDVYTIDVSVSDDDGGSDTDAAAVTVDNLPPVVDAGPDQVAYEDVVVSLAPVTFTDPGTADTHTATIDWGDGTVEPGTVVASSGAGTVAGSHTYLDADTYHVTVSVSDDDGGVGSDTLVVKAAHGFLRFCAFAGDSSSEAVGLFENADVQCDLGGNGRLDIQKLATITGRVVSVSGRVDLGEAAGITGNVQAAGAVQLFKQSLVGGSVTSGSNVTLKRQARVLGDVTAAGQVHLEAGAVVNGTIWQGVPVPPIPPVTPVQVAVSAGGPNITVARNSTRTLAPGLYGTLTVREGATLVLSAGSYAFDWVNVEKGARVRAALAGGNLVVDVVHELVLKDNVQMTVTGGSAANMLFRVQGGRIALAKAGNFLGTYVGPSAVVRLGEGANLRGALFGRKLVIKKNSTLIGEPALDLFVAQFLP
jgi:CSLREA domain-containing protein